MCEKTFQVGEIILQIFVSNKIFEVGRDASKKVLGTQSKKVLGT